METLEGTVGEKKELNYIKNAFGSSCISAVSQYKFSFCKFDFVNLKRKCHGYVASVRELNQFQEIWGRK